MGSVYLARDPSLDRRVAIKIIKNFDLEADAKSNYLERFRNEARAAARLSHPSIVQVYDVGEDATFGPYLVFEYVEGRTLKEILREESVTSEFVLSLLRQIAQALEVAHRANVIHRDVKPDNILVSSDGRAKLADFGVARIPDAALTREGQFLGTPCYSAPEAIMKSAYSPASDIFSLAAVAYEMIAGQRAFPGTDALAVANAVINEEPPTPSSQPRPHFSIAAVDTVVMRGLSKSLDKRYDRATTFVRELEAAFGSAGVTVPSTGAHVALANAASSRAPYLLGTLFLAAALIVAALVVRPFGSVVDASEAGVADAGARADSVPRVIPVPREVSGDAAVEPSSATVVAPEISMPRWQREEAAQDALNSARQLIAAGDDDSIARACSLVARAIELDPASSDGEELRNQLAGRCR